MRYLCIHRRRSSKQWARLAQIRPGTKEGRSSKRVTNSMAVWAHRQTHSGLANLFTDKQLPTLPSRTPTRWHVSPIFTTSEIGDCVSFSSRSLVTSGRKRQPILPFAIKTQSGQALDPMKEEVGQMERPSGHKTAYSGKQFETSAQIRPARPQRRAGVIWQRSDKLHPAVWSSQQAHIIPLSRQAACCD